MTLRKLKKKIIYWLSLGILNSLRIVAWLPYSWLQPLGRSMGWCLMKCSPAMVHNVRINIQLCFPELSPEEQDTLVKNNFHCLGTATLESLYSAWANKKKIKRLLQDIKGLDALENAAKNKEGVIILFPHLMSMYLAGHILLENTDLSFSIMYHSPKNPALRKFMHDNIKRHVGQLFNRREFKSLIRHLKKGNIVWYAPDLDFGKRHSVFANFFDQPAATLPIPHRLAKMAKASTFAIGFYRREDKKGYDIELKCLDHFPSQSEADDLQRVNNEVEAIIRKQPEQYLWCYQRFRTQPDGRSPYAENE